MDKTQRFSFKSLDELVEAFALRGHTLPVSQDVSILASPVRFGRLTVPNRMVIQPMEGCDATPQGAPSELTIRKYRRFAAGGAGMIWWEACAVVPQGRANPGQLWLTRHTIDSFKTMLAATRQAAIESVGYAPICILQLTHSGRYSRPVDKPAPIIAHHSAVLDSRHNLPPDYPLISDEQLDALQDDFVRAAELAAEVGFDAVDIKSCHRYLLSELLASFTRENSRYGGSFDNRTRMLRQTVAAVAKAVGGRLEVTCRLNAFDAIARPYGWGVDKNDATKPDLSEPIELIRQLQQQGVGGLNITIGNPYSNPYVNRPADWMIAQWPDPPEQPLEGVARILGVTREIQRALPGMAVIGSGYSWLRQYYPQVAAGAIQQGWASLAGLGRGGLAYPDFAKDIILGRGMDRHKTCVACSSCTQMMRDGQVSGCVIRDAQVYAPIFRKGRMRDAQKLRDLASLCRQCADPMCVTGCPAGVEIPEFLGLLADGKEREAYNVLRRRNALPGICGAVCPAGVQCQSQCIRRLINDAAVPIAEIQLNLSQRAVQNGWARLELPAASSGKKVAVVGAGPAGLAAAAELLQRGHHVTVFEKDGVSGGKCGSVIPVSRLSSEATTQEIRAIFASVPTDRLSWKFNRALGRQWNLDALMGEGFDAVVLAMGLGGGAGLGGASRPGGVVEANDFLRQMNRNPDHICPPRVAVIGGGNTAVDAALCALRHGSADTYLAYRRSYQQMPAWPAERDEALHGGVHLMLLCQPISYVSDSAGKLTGLRMARTELGPADASGRRKPVVVPNSEFVLSVDMAIEALGEDIAADLADAIGAVELADGLIKADPDTGATSRSGVWAAGDITNGGMTVVKAVAQGRAAAIDIDRYMKSPGQ